MGIKTIIIIIIKVIILRISWYVVACSGLPKRYGDYLNICGSLFSESLPVYSATVGNSPRTVTQKNEKVNALYYSLLWASPHFLLRINLKPWIYWRWPGAGSYITNVCVTHGVLVTVSYDVTINYYWWRVTAINAEILNKKILQRKIEDRRWEKPPRCVLLSIPLRWKENKNKLLQGVANQIFLSP